MKKFFGDDLLLSNDTALELYGYVKNFPIYDYHCHLNPAEIYDDKKFSDIGELWLSCDHYKWRAMRLCGIDEAYITGGKSNYEKFTAYASVMPKLIGNPLYYWTHMELKQIFGINKPLNADSADEIWKACKEKLKGISVKGLIKKFNVKFIATTDDPADSLEYHGTYDGFTLSPTFRPDKVFKLNDEYLKKLGEAAEVKINTLNGLLLALEKRLQFFISKGCKISDYGLSNIPDFCMKDEAEKIFLKRADLTDNERERFTGFMLCYFAKLSKKYNIAMQWHFSPLRNINDTMFDLLGADSGFDVFDNEISAKKLASILNYLNKNDELPKIILYTLNPKANEMICAISGAFKDVRIGTAWWFNDTLEGTRQHLKTVMEYAALGTHLGMLTDSRSYTSYVRHDFFRRVVVAEVASLIEKGEYDKLSAKELLKGICYQNVVDYLKL